jgi:putative transposase
LLAILKQAEGGSPVPEICREHGMSSATFYKWRSKYGGMDASLMARLNELEDENRRLKKMYAEEWPKAEIVQDALQKSGEAILPTRDGATNHREWRHHAAAPLLLPDGQGTRSEMIMPCESGFPA